MNAILIIKTDCLKERSRTDKAKPPCRFYMYDRVAVIISSSTSSADAKTRAASLLAPVFLQTLSPDHTSAANSASPHAAGQGLAARSGAGCSPCVAVHSHGTERHSAL